MNTSNCDILMTACDVKVCRVCFTTDNKLCQMKENKIMCKAYETLTGLLMETEDYLPSYLCTECSQQLKNCARFRSRSLQAHSILMEIVKKYDCITLETIQSINSDPLCYDSLSSVSTDLTQTTNQYKLDIEFIKQENLCIDEQADTNRVELQNITVDIIKTEADLLNSDILNEDTDNGVTVYLSSLRGSVADDSYEGDHGQKTKEVTNQDMEYGTASAGEGFSSDDCLPLGEVKLKAKENSAPLHKATRISKDLQRPDPERLIVNNELSSDMYPYQTVSEVQLSDLKVNGMSKSYNCNMCNYKTMYKKRLTCHERVHSVDKPHSCDVCKKSFRRKSHLQSHMQIHSGERSCYSCNVCNKSFTLKSTLQRHFRKHSGVKPFSCNLCSKAFCRRYQLQTHLRIHSGEKPYLCNVCYKTFNEKSNLQRHFRKHSGIKPYACDLCNKAFAGKYQLQAHLRIHSGEKPYLCDVCDISFTRNNDLQRHLREHLGDKPYSCEVCKKAFSRKHSLKIHLEKHSGE